MKQLFPRLPRALATVAAGLFLGTLASAQDPQETPVPEEEPDLPEIVIPSLDGGMDPEQEMIQLFHEVERTLQSIDLELFDASAGRIPVPQGRESGMERLLRSHGEKSDSAVAGSCSKPGGSGQPKPTGGSPLDQERQRGPTQQENTPEAPKPDGQKQEQQQQDKPHPEGEKPKDGGQNPPPGENRPSPPRIDPSGPAVPPGEDAERWGSLPERVQRVFQNQITDDLPLQYRDWIDSYYRRLSKVR